MENTNYICRSGMSSLSTLLFPHRHIFKKRFYLFIFRERGREGEREGEKHQCVVVCCTSPTGDPAGNPGMCPNWESNWQPLGLQARTQSTELHQPGPYCLIFISAYHEILLFYIVNVFKVIHIFALCDIS